MPNWILRILPLALVVALATMPATSEAKLKVAASTTDLASITSSIGGEYVETFAIARPNTDVHRVEMLPSYMVKVSRADLYLKVGLTLDQWADGIIDGSRNSKLLVVDCSAGIQPLDVPQQATKLMGDVHPLGNPHYWLDPRNGATIARTVARALATRDPAHAEAYEARAEAFAEEMETAYEKLRERARPLAGGSLLTYHASWIYFTEAFDLEIAGTAEPVPGIPPTARHLAELVAIAKSKKIPAFLQEPYFSDDAGDFLARETGVGVVKAAPSCDGPEPGSYLRHIQDLLDAILAHAGGVPSP
jgi:zinc/manganese transport system substrate-binding protein